MDFIGINVEKEVGENIQTKEIKVSPLKSGSPLQEQNEGGFRDIINKARETYTSNWHDVQSYIKSFGGNLEDNAHVSTLSDLNHFDELTMKKKLVICDMVRLNFKEEDIQEAVHYLEGLSEHLSKEEILKRIAEGLLDNRKELSNSMENRLKLLKTEANALPSLHHIMGDVQAPAEPDDIHIMDLPLGDATEHSLSLENLESEGNGDASNKNAKQDSGRQIDSDFPQKSQKREINQNQQKGGETSSMNKAICPICFDNLPHTEFAPIQKCGHIFCRDCCKSHIQEHLTIDKILSIKCPSDGCNNQFTQEQTTQLLEQELVEKYTRLKKVALLNQNPNLRWCVRPGCDKYVIGKLGKRKLVCECKTKICFSCGNQYHTFKSCETIINSVYEKYAKEKHVQGCPQCKSRIEKNGGCNHMTCTRCNYQWCWLCGVTYEPDHYAPSNPNRCAKLSAPNSLVLDGQEPPERETYCSRMCQEPARIFAFPIFLIISSILVPQWLYSERKRRKGNRDYNFSNEAKTPEIFFFVILGMLFLPISFIVFFSIVLYDGIVDFCIWFCQKTMRKDIRATAPRVLEPQML